MNKIILTTGSRKKRTQRHGTLLTPVHYSGHEWGSHRKKKNNNCNAKNISNKQGTPADTDQIRNLTVTELILLNDLYSCIHDTTLYIVSRFLNNVVTG